MSLFDLSDRVCIVTGSTKGLGRAMAERLAEHGARVVVCSRHADQCDAVAAQLNRRYGAGRAIGAPFDLSQRDTIETPAARALDAWGRIDVTIANAAVIKHGAPETAAEEDLDLSMNANVRNNLALARSVIPAMKRQGGGSIVFVLSTLGIFASPPFLPYAVGKAALMHLTKILAVDLGPANVRVNAICPGIFRTFSTADFAADAEKLKIALARNPLGRIGEPDEIAACAVLLASPGGGYLNGHVMVVDGGQVLQGHEGARDLMEIARGKS